MSEKANMKLARRTCSMMVIGLLEKLDLSADRRERSKFMLPLAEMICVRAVGHVHRLKQQVGEVVREAGTGRPLLRQYKCRYVPRLLDA